MRMFGEAPAPAACDCRAHMPMRYANGLVALYSQWRCPGCHVLYRRVTDGRGEWWQPHALPLPRIREERKILGGLLS